MLPCSVAVGPGHLAARHAGDPLAVDGDVDQRVGGEPVGHQRHGLALLLLRAGRHVAGGQGLEGSARACAAAGAARAQASTPAGTTRRKGMTAG